MHSTRNPRMLMTMFLASLLPLAVQTANAGDTRIDNEISADLADARSEVRTEAGPAGSGHVCPGQQRRHQGT